MLHDFKCHWQANFKVVACQPSKGKNLVEFSNALEGKPM